MKNVNEEYQGYVKKNASGVALISVFILPLTIFASLIFTPQQGYSDSVFAITGLIFIFILFLYGYLHAVIKNSELKYTSVALFLMFLIFTLNIFKEQSVFGNSTKMQLLMVNKKAEEMVKEKSMLVSANTGVDAEAIFNAKCSSCHKFDVKLVGPPYQETIPKYNGDVKKLATYIYNPQKINPAYPPMPNQGLKQKEADALAQWLIKKISTKK